VSLAGCVLGTALLAGSGAVVARNDKLLLPIDAAMRNAATRAVLGSDIALRFGRASAGGETDFVQVHSVADPFRSQRARPGGLRAQCEGRLQALRGERLRRVEQMTEIP
jgi:hypothetical protein